MFSIFFTLKVREHIITLKTFISHPKKCFPKTAAALAQVMSNDTRATDHFQQQVNCKLSSVIQVLIKPKILNYPDQKNNKVKHLTLLTTTNLQVWFTYYKFCFFRFKCQC